MRACQVDITFTLPPVLFLSPVLISSLNVYINIITLFTESNNIPTQFTEYETCLKQMTDVVWMCSWLYPVVDHHIWGHQGKSMCLLPYPGCQNKSTVCSPPVFSVFGSADMSNATRGPAKNKCTSLHWNDWAVERPCRAIRFLTTNHNQQTGSEICHL